MRINNNQYTSLNESIFTLLDESVPPQPVDGSWQQDMHTREWIAPIDSDWNMHQGAMVLNWLIQMKKDLDDSDMVQIFQKGVEQMKEFEKKYRDIEDTGVEESYQLFELDTPPAETPKQSPNTPVDTPTPKKKHIKPYGYHYWPRLNVILNRLWVERQAIA